MQLVTTTTPAEEIAGIEREAARVAARLAEARQRADLEAKRSVEERAQPLRHEDAVLQAQLAALDAKADGVLREAVAQGHALYHQHCEIQARRNALAGKIQAITNARVYASEPAPFVTLALAAFRRLAQTPWHDATPTTEGQK